MADHTKINWCDASLALVTGCTPAGEGCRHCYAERMFHRLASMPKLEKYYGREFSHVQFHLDELPVPRCWKKPRSIFISPMGDLFHKDVRDWHIYHTFRMFKETPQHTHIVLTKRVDRALAMSRETLSLDWPDNVVLGCSCSTQGDADRLIPLLVDVPAGRLIVSFEPLVERVHVPEALLAKLSGIIVGGESGPNSRPMHPGHVRSLRNQCEATLTPFFFKQWGDALNGVSILGSRRSALTEGGWSPHEPHGGRVLDGRTHDALCWTVRP